VTDYSRSEVKILLRSGRITIDEKRQRDASYKITEDTIVCLDGEPLRKAGHRYIMLNKPLGYVSATKDREHLTVIELLDEDNSDQLHIAGRLDIDTTGLVLITDDGQWSHRVTSPSRDCKKVYLLETTDPITQTMIERIEEGVELHNEKKPTLPATIVLVDEHTARLSIREGKYHQVKRMLAAVGNKVDVLHREQIGDIVLDDALMPGEYRYLTEQEVASL
jgi:16S rRNA pseudouridine516 synthase